VLIVVALSLSLSNCCPLVQQYRAQGFSDAQIEQIARERGVPRWIIAWAKRHCRDA
jgi:hypothetical protein